MSGTKRYCFSKIHVLLLMLFAMLFLVCCDSAPDKSEASDNTEVICDTTEPTETNRIIVYIPDEGEIVEYMLHSAETFREFLSLPSKELLSQESTVITYRKSAVDLRYVERNVITADGMQYEFSDSGFLLESIVVDSAFIEFINSIDEYLMQNGIESTTSRCALISSIGHPSAEIPVTIWVVSGDENYFITVNEEVVTVDVQEVAYILYTQNEYTNKFGVKDGKLFINHTEVAGNNHVKFENQAVFLPFFTVMDQLDIKCDLAEDKDKVKLTFGNDEYSLQLESDFGPTIFDKDGEIIAHSGWNHYYEMIDDELILDHLQITRLLSWMGAEISIDYENLVVVISAEV